jgi:hypothetical protein
MPVLSFVLSVAGLAQSGEGKKLLEKLSKPDEAT